MAASPPPSQSADGVSFFTLEASECLERLDAALGKAGVAGPPIEEFVGAARTLRGAAIMHRMAGMAELARGVERAGRALREGAVGWSPALAAAIVAAVDDLKLLLRVVRTWGPAEDARVAKRVADLARYAPSVTDATPPLSAPPPASAARDVHRGSDYIAREVIEIADALDAGAALGLASAMTPALSRLRTLRGVAAVADLPPIGEILEAVDRAGRSLETAGNGATTLPAAYRALFHTAVVALRRAAGDLERLGRPAPDSPELAAFRTARNTATAQAQDADRIVPIAELGYADGAPDVVQAAPNPPTTRAERFRLEVVSQAEHLLLLVAEARDATDGGAESGGGGAKLPPQLATELTTALRAVRDAARSFGERDIAELLGTFTDGRPTLDFLTLNAIDDVARALADPAAGADVDLSARMSALARGRAVDAGIGLALAGGDQPISETPAARPPSPPEPERRRARTPTGPALHALLADGLSGLLSLNEQPLADISAVPSSLTAGVVPIEALLYRGRAALDRARALRDALRSAPGRPSPSREVLDELLDLIDLAAVHT